MARGCVNLYIGFETGADCCTGLSVQVIGQYAGAGRRKKFGCRWRCLMRNAKALVSARASALRLSATTDEAYSPDHRAFCELWAIDRFRARMVSPRRGLAHGSYALAGPPRVLLGGNCPRLRRPKIGVRSGTQGDTGFCRGQPPLPQA